jgi:pyruvate dehydrogenase E2 component (dihydrolipoamide acetyltransferase)
MTDIKMPRLADAMEHGTILSWLIDDGQPVAKGADLVEIETDKATVTHQAEAEGILEVAAPEGATLAVGETIARIGPLVSQVGDAAPEQTPAPAPAPTATSAPTPPRREAPGVATPLAHRVARAHGVSLSALAGTGPRGRITRRDVLHAAGIGAPQPSTNGDDPPPPAPAPAPRDGGDSSRGTPTVTTPTRLQALIARRMVEAKSTVPEFGVQTEVAMDAVVALRAQVRDQAGEGDVAPSLNDFIVKAAALALRAHPRANSSYVDGDFVHHGRVNVGVAVAAEDALIVPTVFDADEKSMGEIARTVRRLADDARDGRVRPEDLSGGTFTVSNLGMFGMTAIAPVINPPQAAILGVGSLREVLARVDGRIVDQQVMTLTLTCDHRILYGADAARLLSQIRSLLEAPLRLAL